MISWYDLSPMRPDEYANTNAYRWHEALTLRNAYDVGLAEAKHEKAIHDKLQNAPDMQA